MRKFIHVVTNVEATLHDNGVFMIDGDTVPLPNWMIKGIDWEEVFECPGQIEAFRNNVHLNIWTRKTENMFCFDAYRSTLKYLSNCGHYHIHAVRRTADGTIFHIGDNVYTLNEFGKVSNPGIITGFNIVRNKIHVVINHAAVHRPEYFVIMHKGKRVLITEEGIDVFDTKKVLYMVDKGNIVQEIEAHNFAPFKAVAKVFFDKKLAEDYIADMNKTVFTTEDGLALSKNMLTSRLTLHAVLVKGSWEKTAINGDHVKQYLENNTKPTILKSKDWKVFSSVEARRMYELLNKPSISFNQLVEFNKNFKLSKIYKDSLINLFKPKTETK